MVTQYTRSTYYLGLTERQLLKKEARKRKLDINLCKSLLVREAVRKSYGPIIVK